MRRGLILLLFLAVLCALFTVRMRRRHGHGVDAAGPGCMVITGFVLIVLRLWVGPAVAPARRGRPVSAGRRRRP